MRGLFEIVARRRGSYVESLISDLEDMGASMEVKGLRSPLLNKSNIDLGLRLLHQAELLSKNMKLKAKLAMLRHTIEQRS